MTTQTTSLVFAQNLAPAQGLAAMEAFRAYYHNEVNALSVVERFDDNTQSPLEHAQEAWAKKLEEWDEQGGTWYRPSPPVVMTTGQRVTILHETCTGVTRARLVLEADGSATFSVERDEPFEPSDRRSSFFGSLQRALDGSALQSWSVAFSVLSGQLGQALSLAQALSQTTLPYPSIGGLRLRAEVEMGVLCEFEDSAQERFTLVVPKEALATIVADALEEGFAPSPARLFEAAVMVMRHGHRMDLGDLLR